MELNVSDALKKNGHIAKDTQKPTVAWKEEQKNNIQCNHFSHTLLASPTGLKLLEKKEI